MPLVLALDQGTTGSTALVVDEGGRVLGRGYREITQYYPQPGWVEHDPEEIWSATLAAGRQALTAARAAGSDLEWTLKKLRPRLSSTAYGTVDSWLVHRLTTGDAHVTDPTNASRTMLYDIGALQWDDVLLKLFRVPREILPEVRPSSGLCGVAAAEWFGAEVPIAGIAGDQQAALFGQAGFVAGLIVEAKEAETLAMSVPDTGGAVFVPAFVGLGAPHWESGARGAIFGLTRGTTKAHLVRGRWRRWRTPPARSWTRWQRAIRATLSLAKDD